jgi:hypothetical protein
MALVMFYYVLLAKVQELSQVAQFVLSSKLLV